MGYNLTIGNAEMEYNKDCVRIVATSHRLDEAPAFGEPTDYTNQRWPSYTSWSEAMETLGLMDVMFNHRNGGGGFERNGDFYSPLLEIHPGATPITLAHVEEVEERIAAYKAANPDHIAQYPPLKPDAEPLVAGSRFYGVDAYVDDPKFDSALCRGEWLVFWLRWAIENCERPVFVNT